jgi:hypothetical protein
MRSSIRTALFRLSLLAGSLVAQPLVAEACPDWGSNGISVAYGEWGDMFICTVQVTCEDRADGEHYETSNPNCSLWFN